MGLFGPRRLNHKEMGERSEAIIIGRLVYSGYTVLKPYGENQRYDLVIEDADRQFWRVHQFRYFTFGSSKKQQPARYSYGTRL